MLLQVSAPPPFASRQKIRGGRFRSLALQRSYALAREELGLADTFQPADKGLTVRL